MSKFEVIGEIKFPSWAACAYYNGDTSGMSDEDISIFEQWEESLKNRYPEHNDITLDIGEFEPDFEPFPEFGLASDCYAAKLWGHTRTETGQK